jgi:NADPH2:quinone reductase
VDLSRQARARLESAEFPNRKEEKMGQIHAVLVDPNAPAHLALGEVEVPSPAPSEALVRISAISLNLGEVRRAQAADEGTRPGWDLAGTVERAADDGSGPEEGVRVVGLLASGAWAELVAVPTNALAMLPEGVSFEQASTLPVAGLTALYALEKGGGLIGRRVLVAGASGGAGHFALQLARMSGAHVTALVRREEHEELVREAGAHEVAIGEDASMAERFGPFHLILESIGGKSLGEAMGMLAPHGVCVTFGVSGGAEATFDIGTFFYTGGARLYGFIIFQEVLWQPASDGLARLLRLVDEKRLRPHISVEASWEEVGEVAQRLLYRGYTGKAVLRVAE